MIKQKLSIKFEELLQEVLLFSFLIPESLPELGKPFKALFPHIYGHLQDVLPGEHAFLSQERCAVLMLKGRDFLLNAGTSGGKTEAVLFPAIERLYVTKNEQGADIFSMKRLVVFFPTKPLLQTLVQRLGQRYQITERLGLLFLRYDGDLNAAVKEKKRKVAVQQQPEILLTTPDQFYMSISHGKGPWLDYLLDMDTLWIDELDMYTGKALFNLELLVNVLRLHHEAKDKNLQVVITGATILQPQQIVDRFLRNGVIISGKGQHGEIEVAICQIPKLKYSHKHKRAMLAINEIIEQIIATNKKFIVFVDPRFSTEFLALEKNLKSYRVKSFHAKLDSATKQQILEEFRTSKLQGLYCTCLLEVGIDIGDLEYVVLLGLPFEPDRGTPQRLGRVARRCGMHGKVYIVLPREDRVCDYYATNTDELETLVRLERTHYSKPLPLYDCVEECVMAFISLALKFEITDLALIQQRFVSDNPSLFTQALTELFCEGAINEINGTLIPTCESTLSSIRIDNNFRECGEMLSIIHRGKKIGEMEKWRIPICGLLDCYFIHGGQTYNVVNLSQDTNSLEVESFDGYRFSRNKTTVTVQQDCRSQMDHPNYILTYGPCTITETVENLIHENLQKGTLISKKSTSPFIMKYSTMGLSLEFKKPYKSDLIKFFKDLLLLNVDQVGVLPTHLSSFYYNDRLYLVDRNRPRGASLFLFQHFTELIDVLASNQVKFVLINEWQKLHHFVNDLEGTICTVW